MPERAAFVPDFWHVVSAIHEIVEVGDAAGGYGCQTDEEAELKGEDKDEAKKNNEAARLWISGMDL